MSYRAVPTSQIAQNIKNIDRKNVAQSTRLLQRYAANPLHPTLYEVAIVSPKVRCTLSMHQLAGKPLHVCHVIAERIDRLIREGGPYMECCFIRIWSKLVSRIKMKLPECNRCYNQSAELFYLFCFYGFGL
jgi:hypothetical protein